MCEVEDVKEDKKSKEEGVMNKIVYLKEGIDLMKCYD